MRTNMRPYTGPADLRAMQDLTQRLWSDKSSHHVGDLAWGRFMFTRETADWPIALWEAEGRVIAWAWAAPGDLKTQVDPAHADLMDEVLDWLEANAGDEPREYTFLDAETGLSARLEERGYQEQQGAPYFAYHSRPLTDLPEEPVLPEGFHARAVRTQDDLAQRVAVHQAAWNSTRVTAESYRAVMDAWPYRPELDWIVEGPDGAFAANCLIWYDDLNRVGLIEPVGTAPSHRRKGLSRAVCLAALHALREAGATSAIVYPRGDADYPIPQQLYRGMGFTPYARTRSWRRSG
ncbi:GNAT family N-acetyltransferase [Streptomyces noursei]|uniref:GNAT family N-acetyltransferase n=1 Tax=Streptomyces noursei TaxID=1971 RepID=UPI0030F24095